MLRHFLRLTGVALLVCISATALAEVPEAPQDPAQLALRLFEEMGAKPKSCDKMVEIVGMDLTGLLLCARSAEQDKQVLRTSIEDLLQRWTDQGVLRIQGEWAEETVPLFKATRARIRTVLLEAGDRHLRLFIEMRKKGRILVTVPDPLHCECGAMQIDTTDPSWTLPKKIPHTRVRSRYPGVAGWLLLSADVEVWATIRTDGSVSDVCPFHSTNPGLGFEELARVAIEQWRYEPARKNGEPVDACFRVLMDFDPY